MSTRRPSTTFGPSSLLVLVAAAASVALATATHAAARPSSVQIVLNPDRDTFLAEGIGTAQDGAEEISCGYIYSMRRTRQYRAYLHFPLDPVKHPPRSLLQAELWLHPREKPDTSALSAKFRIRTMTEDLVPGRMAPFWFEAGEPAVEQSLDVLQVTWKVIRVRDLVRNILTNPGTAYGFEISGVEPQENTRFDFISMDGDRPYPDGLQPRLVLTFSDEILPTMTLAPSGTPTASATPTVTRAPSDTPTAPPPTVETATPATTASPIASPSVTATPSAVALLLPRLLRNR